MIQQTDTSTMNTSVVPIVIGSSYNAYGVIRGFAEEGIRSILVTGSHKCFVQYSKYIEQHVVAADAGQDEERFIAELLELGKSISPRRGMFFPTHDEQLAALAKHKDVLSPYFEFPFSDWEICSQIMDKANFRAHCEALGIPTIKECLVSSLSEALNCLETLRLPLIVKANSAESHMVNIFGSKNALFYDEKTYKTYVRRFFEHLPDESLLVQEYIEDGGKMKPNVNCFSDKNGTLRCIHIAEKIRQYPPQTGTSTAFISVDPSDPEYRDICEYTRKILEAYHFYGLVGIEFTYDQREKNYKVIEMNPRSEFLNWLPTFRGQNLAVAVYRYHLGYDVAIPFYPRKMTATMSVPFNDYFYTVHLNRLNYPNFVLTRREWKKTLPAPTEYYGLTAKDLKPFLYAYITSALIGLNAYIRIKKNIPATVRTVDYFIKKKR